MRIGAILLIILGLLLTGWFGYVELYYISKLESKFEDQKINSESIEISRIKETEEKFKIMKDKLKKKNYYVTQDFVEANQDRLQYATHLRPGVDCKQLLVVVD